MSDLKPCPFCGGLPIFRDEETGLFGSKVLFYVVCPVCGVRTQKERVINVVISAWNRRVGENERSD